MGIQPSSMHFRPIFLVTSLGAYPALIQVSAGVFLCKDLYCLCLSSGTAQSTDTCACVGATTFCVGRPKKKHPVKTGTPRTVTLSALDEPQPYSADHCRLVACQSYAALSTGPQQARGPGVVQEGQVHEIDSAKKGRRWHHWLQVCKETAS